MVTRRLNTAKTILVLALGLLLLAGCGNMREQPRLETYDSSPNFGQAARDILPEAVPVGHLDEDVEFHTGLINGEEGNYVEEFPIELNREVVEEGQKLYNGFCSPCHGYSGYGDGVVTQEGFTEPVSFQSDELRDAPIGRYFQAITNGFETMYDLRSVLDPDERWAVIAYIEAMQISQQTALEDLPSELQARFD